MDARMRKTSDREGGLPDGMDGTSSGEAFEIFIY